MALDCSDSGCIHVVVMPVGKKASDELCARVVSALREVPPVQFKDTVVFPRFLKQGDLPKWVEHHVRWEEFFAYKQVFGVLEVACCKDKSDLEELMTDLSQSIDTVLRRTVCCTKYFVLGPKEQLEDLVGENENFYLVGTTSGPGEALDMEAIQKAVSDMAWSIASTLSQQIRAASRHDSVKVFRSQFDVHNPCAEEDIKFLGRGVVQGRTQKHIGDLNLLCGSLQEATNSYVDAVSTLSSTRDLLWLAAAYEGLCIVEIMSKRREDLIGQKAVHTKRSSIIATTNALRVNTGTLSRLFTVRRNAESSGVMDQGTPSPSPSRFLSVEKDIKDGGTSDGSTSSSVNGDLENGEEEEQLRVEFVIKNYSKALENYKKAGTIGDFPRIEATIRFTAFLANQELNADACEVLSELSTLTGISNEDKVMMFEMMGDFCSSLHYTRKASFYYHCAADLIAGSKLLFYDSKALELLQKCFAGYRLPVVEGSNLPMGTAVSAYVDGWPSLKACILRDFVLGDFNRDCYVTIWCASFLLQYYGPSLQQGDLQEVIKVLTAAVKDHNQRVPSSHDAPLPLTTPTNAPLPLTTPIDAPLPLTRVPIVNSFRPKELQGNLTPHRCPDHVSEGSVEGPFIYSALKGRRKGVRQEVVWVTGMPCEVALEISNPFPVELRIEGMKALVEGINSEAYSASLTLPVSSGSVSFLLVVVPKETGFLNILGYEAVIFGLRSKCIVKIPGDPVIKVVPPLPILKARGTTVAPLHSGNPEAKDKYHPLMLSEESNSFSLMDGESCMCEFQVESTHGIPVERMSITSEEWDRDYCQVSCDREAISPQLPLTRGGPLATIKVTITACIPHYLRVNNDFTKGIAKSSLLSYTPGTITTRLSDEQVRSFSSSPERAVDMNVQNFNPRSSASCSPMKPTNESHSSPSGERRGDKMTTLARHLSSQSPSGSRRTVSMRKKVLGYDEVDLNRVHRRSLRLSDGSPDLLRHRTAISNNLDPVTLHKSETVPLDLSGHRHEELLESLHTPPPSPATRGGVVISEPTGPLFRAVPTPSSKRHVTCALVLSYSGGAGHKEGYCRHCELGAVVNVKPSLVFENFDVYQVEGYHHLWSLTFVVKNLSKLDLDITTVISPECSDAPECSKKLEFKVMSKSKRSLELKLKRFLVPNPEMAASVSLSNVTKMYCDRIAKWIRFYWRSSKGSEGVVDLTGLRLPMATLQYIKPAPVLFVMKLNGKQYKPQGEVLECKAGLPIEMVVDITNTSGFLLPASTLKIDPSQFSLQENRIKDVEKLFIHTNTLTIPVPQLENERSFSHKVFVVFLFRGTYQVNVTLYMEDTEEGEGKGGGSAFGRSVMNRSNSWSSESQSGPMPTSQNGPMPTSQSAPMPTSQSAPMPTSQSAPMPTSQSAPMPTSQSAPMPTSQSAPMPTSQDGIFSCPKICVSAGSPPPPSSSALFHQQFQGRQFTGHHVTLHIT